MVVEKEREAVVANEAAGPARGGGFESSTGITCLPDEPSRVLGRLLLPGLARRCSRATGDWREVSVRDTSLKMG